MAPTQERVGARESSGTAGNTRAPRGPSGSSLDNQKCYNCYRFRHIGRDCPNERTHVNQIREVKRGQSTKQVMRLE